DLLPAVAPKIVRGAEARRDLVAEPELDRVLTVIVVRRRVRRDLFILRADAEVERQLVRDAPGILHEEPDDVRLDVALCDEALPRKRPVASDVVEAVQALWSGGIVLRAPFERDCLGLVAAVDVVPAQVELHAALDLMLAARVGEPRRVGLDELAIQD